MNQSITSETVELAFQQLGIQQRIANSTIAGMSRAELVTFMDHMADQMVVQLTGVLLAEPVAEETATTTATVDVERWESWWQHTKSVHFPTLSRWLRRSPRTVTETRAATVSLTCRLHGVYPETNVRVPDLGPVRFMVQSDGPRWGEWM